MYKKIILVLFLFLLPFSIQAVTTIEGEVTVMYVDDFKNNKAHKKYFLNKYELKNLKKNQKDKLNTGSKVKLKGNILGNSISEVEILDIQGVVTELTGVQNVLVLAANFNDRALNCTLPEIDTLMFNDTNSVSDLWEEIAYNKISVVGDSFGPYNINQSYTGICDVSNWGNQLNQFAQNDGINLSNYNRYVYVLPPGPCPAAGYGTVGGSPSRSWIFTCDIADVYAHELGHNFQLGHSSTLVDGNISTYGDTSSIMGLGGGPLRQLNAPQKEDLSFILDYQEVTQSNEYFISPTEADSNSIYPRGLKIFRTVTDELYDEYYYISYRQPIGYDANLSNFHLNSATIHRQRVGTPSSTYRLAVLDDNTSFNIENITVTQLEHTPEYVKVRVELDGVIEPYCGDGNLNTGEQCDDGNNIPGDGCDAFCQIEPYCGDGNLNTGEQCDDGNNIPGDGCDAFCQIEQPPVDNVPPTPPTNLFGKVKGKVVNLNWGASSDNVEVIGYNIYRDAINIATTTSTTYTDSIEFNLVYKYHVIAFDAENNMSDPSNSLFISRKGKGNKK
jgi:cysteine-rich repeat protein